MHVAVIVGTTRKLACVSGIARCLLALQCCQYPQTAEENVRTVRHVAALSVHLGSHSAGDDSSTSCVTQQRTRSAQDGCSDNSPYDCVTYVAGGRYMLHVLPPSGVTCVAYGLQHTKHSPARLVMLAVRGGCLFFKDSVRGAWWSGYRGYPVGMVM